MKRFILVTGLLTAAWGTASGQGTVNFGNATTNAIILTGLGCPVPAGTLFKAALYYLPDRATAPISADFDVYGLVLDPPAAFAAPGYFAGGTRSTPPSTPGGGAAWFQVRVWETAFGSTYEQALINPTPIGGRLAMLGTSNIIRVTTGSPLTTPPGLPASLVNAGLQGFCLGWCNRCFIPEPPVTVLGLIGALGLLLAGWRKRSAESGSSR